MSTILSVTEARKRIFELVGLVKEQQEEVVCTERGKAVAVLMSHTQYERWKTTVQALDDKTTKKALLSAEADYLEGLHDSLDEIFAANGYIAADKIEEYYGKNNKK